jgi:hypothetical protein
MMRQFPRLNARLAAVLAAGAVGLAVPLLPAAASAASANATCSGGSVAAGTYRSLTVTGFCSVDAGAVTVTKNLRVAHGAALIAAFGGSDLNVGGNLTVGPHAILVLGCEPEAFPCLNDPNSATGGTMSTSDRVGGNLAADRALMMVVHNNSIAGNVTQSGGGGGVNCTTFPLGPDGPPAYSTYEDNTIGRNASVTGLRTCWLGFIRNTVARNVNFNDNRTADPDGNEVVTNTIKWNLNCHANSPAPQVGDSEGSPNTVGRKATGQCVGLT